MEFDLKKCIVFQKNISEERNFLTDTILNDNSNFTNLSDFEKMIYLMQYCQHELLSYIQNKAWSMRTSRLDH